MKVWVGCIVGKGVVLVRECGTVCDGCGWNDVGMVGTQ